MNSLSFAFTNSVLPKYRVKYYDYNIIIRSNLWRPPAGYIILTVYHVLAYVLTAKYENDVPLTF